MVRAPQASNAGRYRRVQGAFYGTVRRPMGYPIVVCRRVALFIQLRVNEAQLHRVTITVPLRVQGVQVKA